MDYIRFIDVKKYYAGSAALNCLNFSINKGEFVALIGNNGCGKTTTINILGNLIPYDSGEVIVFNDKVTPKNTHFKSRLGFLLNPPILVNEFTISQYLEFVCFYQNVDRGEIIHRVQSLVDCLRLATNKKKISDLSAGERMKVALAGAFVHNPEILVLDEPFVHLDLLTIEILMNLIKIYMKSKTIFITSHNLELVVNLCNRFLIMEEGRIKLDLNSNSCLKEVLKKQISDTLLTSGFNLKKLDWLL
jgi:ABC-2 type transport system ATP-binding protein